MICSIFKSRLLKNVVLSSFLFVFAGLSSVLASESSPKYIFLLIGDGMGTSQRMAAEYYYRSSQLNAGVPRSELKKLDINNLPVKAITSTFSSDAVITDSAASGTSLATGHKTRNGVISMDSSKTRKLKTIAEVAKEKGRKVGILSNVWINHATPASFYAHKPSRDMYYEIAMDLAECDFDYFGGGRANHISKGELKGRPDPLKVAKKNGFTIVDTREELEALEVGCGKVWAYDEKQSDLHYAIDKPEGALELDDYVTKAIELLDNPNGFFMMIEGGKIDWVCHANDAASAIKDTIALNETYKLVKKFYDKHPDETLIIVTADHECGGMKFGPEAVHSRNFAKIIDMQKGTDSSFRPVVEKCKNEKMSFDDALACMGEFFGIDYLNDREKKIIRDAFIKGGSKEGDYSYGNNGAITIAWTKVLNDRAGIAWTSFSHTGVPVMTTAIGVGSEHFGGAYDNTDLSKNLLMLIESEVEAVK